MTPFLWHFYAQKWSNGIEAIPGTKRIAMRMQPEHHDPEHHDPEHHDVEHHDVVTHMYSTLMKRPQEEEIIPPLQEQMHEAQRLADELTLLLASYQPLLEREGIRDQVETLQYWAECYRNGLNAADQISQNAGTMVACLQERTKLATEELHRFEDDGGPVANKQQAAETEGMARVTKRLSQVAPSVENLTHFANQVRRHS
jgi:hypothetical protein